jgi:hypothetical protein
LLAYAFNPRPSPVYLSFLISGHMLQLVWERHTISMSKPFQLRPSSAFVVSKKEGKPKGRSAGASADRMSVEILLRQR